LTANPTHHVETVDVDQPGHQRAAPMLGFLLANSISPDALTNQQCGIDGSDMGFFDSLLANQITFSSKSESAVSSTAP